MGEPPITTTAIYSNHSMINFPCTEFWHPLFTTRLRLRTKSVNQSDDLSSQRLHRVPTSADMHCHMEVSQNVGTPNSWMVYSGKSQSTVKWMIWEYPYFRNPPHVQHAKQHCGGKKRVAADVPPTSLE